MTNNFKSREMLDIEYDRMAVAESEMWWYSSLHLSLLDRIKELHCTNKSIRILDAGCGTGGFMRFLLAAGYTELIGLDISKLAIAACRRDGLTVMRGSISDRSVLQGIGRFDVIVSLDVVCSLPNDVERVQFFQGAYDILNSSGTMIVQTPAFRCMAGIHDIAVGVNKRFNKAEMSGLLNKSSIPNVRIGYRLMLLAPVIFIVRFFQRIKLKTIKNVSITSDVVRPNRLINKMLYMLQRFEDKHIKYKPFGTSLQIEILKDD